MRMGFVPEVEMPHLKASSFNWASLRVVGRVSAIHDRVVDIEGSETREHVPRLVEPMQGYHHCCTSLKRV